MTQEVFKAFISLILIEINQGAKGAILSSQMPPKARAKQLGMIGKEVDGWLSPIGHSFTSTFSSQWQNMWFFYFYFPTVAKYGKNAKEGICVNGVFPGSEDEMLEG